jgi:hypothetical protein
MITRDEYSKYVAVKSKLGLQNKATQTEPESSSIIPIICTILPDTLSVRRNRRHIVYNSQDEDTETSTPTPSNTQDEGTQCEDECEDEYEERSGDEDDDEDESTTSANVKKKVHEIFNSMKKKRYVNPDDEN